MKSTFDRLADLQRIATKQALEIIRLRRQIQELERKAVPLEEPCQTAEILKAYSHALRERPERTRYGWLEAGWNAALATKAVPLDPEIASGPDSSRRKI